MLYINREEDTYQLYRKRIVQETCTERDRDVKESCTVTGMFRSTTQDERRMFRRAVQAQRGMFRSTTQDETKMFRITIQEVRELDVYPVLIGYASKKHRDIHQ